MNGISSLHHLSVSKGGENRSVVVQNLGCRKIISVGERLVSRGHERRSRRFD